MLAKSSDRFQDRNRFNSRRVMELIALKSSTLRPTLAGAESSAHWSRNNKLTSVYSRNSATGEYS
jgi:hypothetical protein